MARSITSDRTLIQNYTSSVRLVDSSSMQITCPGAANYTTSIIGDFTILAYVNLEAVPNSSVTTHSIISSNAATVATNMLLTVDKFTRKVSNRITDGVGSQTLTSSIAVPSGWGWIGEGYQAGVALKTIVGTNIETTAPTITAVANASRTLYVSSTNANTYVRGNIARLWIFGGQITQAELRDVVFKGLIPPSLTKALIWNMTEGSGTTLTDSSVNSNTGTFVGSVSWSTSNVPLVSRTAATTRSIPAALVTRTTI